MLSRIKQNKRVLFVKNKNSSQHRLSDEKIGLLPIFIVNWVFGLNILEVPLNNPRPKSSLVLFLIVWCSYAYSFISIFFKEYSEDLSKEGNVNYTMTRTYYFTSVFVFTCCMIISLYNSEVIIMCFSK